MKAVLTNMVKRRAQDAVVGFAAAATSALIAEGVKRVLPEAVMENGRHMTALLRILADKPGAPRMPSSANPDEVEWRFGYGHLIFQDSGHWFHASRTPKRRDEGLAGAPAQYSNHPSSRDDLASESASGILRIRALTGGGASLKKLLDGAIDRFINKREVALYNWENSWEYLESKAPRPLATVAVEGDLAERLLADIAGFKADEAWYKIHHVPYRRGYLLYGPPGSGKSTLAGALAAEAGLNVCVLSLANKDLDDNRFMQALRQMPHNSILLLEDVDAVNAQTERRTEEYIGDLEAISQGHPAYDGPGTMMVSSYHPAGRLTLAGILNALDGLTTPSGLIVMMTTNHREKLDPALIRPGRVDVHAEISLATKTQARDLYQRFFPVESEEFGWDQVFAETVPAGVISPAAIQEHLVRHRYQPEEAKKGLKEFA